MICSFRDEESFRETSRIAREMDLEIKNFPLVSYRAMPNFNLENELHGFSYQYIFLASAHSARLFFKRLHEFDFNGKSFLCVGEKAAEIIRNAGIEPAFQATNMKALGDFKELKGQRIFYPCSNEYDRQDLLELQSKELQLNPVPFYQVILSPPGADLRRLVDSSNPVFLIMAPSQAKGLVEYAKAGVRVVCPGERTAKRIGELGFTHVIFPTKSENITAACLQLCSSIIKSSEFKGSQKQ